jgi:hydrogenase maturation protein HypF
MKNGNQGELRPSFVVDWSHLVLNVLDDVNKGEAASRIALKFHNTLCEVIVDVAHLAGEQRVVLTGGCFQNKYLTERTIRRLNEEGFRPYWHQRVPPNDGGIALGQVYAFRRSNADVLHTNTASESETSIHNHQLNQEQELR